MPGFGRDRWSEFVLMNIYQILFKHFLKEVKTLEIRKSDYVIVFLLSVVFYGIQIMAPIKTVNIAGLFMSSLITAAIIGTITNFIVKRKRK
ncbi:MAG: hypothetical protein IMZ47_00415 [Firmicutes bacterium]|nr:hypothetical protein [Bacillota bacterium]